MTTSPKYKRAHKQLELFRVRTGMTEEGKQWLICAFDPFHDQALDLRGIPDRAEGNSIVQCIKRQSTISITGVPQDVLIVTDPLQFRVGGIFSRMFRQYFDPTADASGINMGGLSIIRVNAGGDPLDPASPGFTQSGLTTSAPYVVERSRALSRGFEVHNTTPELYKGGSVTCFHQNQTRNEFSFMLAANTALVSASKKKDLIPVVTSSEPDVDSRKLEKKHAKLTGPANRIFSVADFLPIEPPPRSVATATLLPLSHGWEASKGCYCVARQNQADNPPTYPVPVVGLHTTDSTGTETFCADFPQTPDGLDFNMTGDYVAVDDEFACPMNRRLPFNTCGAYFTGLPVNTELTIFYNEWIERFPTTTQSDLIVLSKPSACFDPIALEAYAHICKTMPVAMVAKANGLGDWFCDAVAGLVDFCTDSTWASKGLGVLNGLMSKHSTEATNQGSSVVWQGNGNRSMIVRPPPNRQNNNNNGNQVNRNQQNNNNRNAGQPNHNGQNGQRGGSKPLPPTPKKVNK